MLQPFSFPPALLILASAVAAQNQRISDALAPSGDVRDVFALPGSSGALYVADGDVDDVFELYRTNLGGGPVTKLSGALVSGGDVLDVLVTPDGALALYLADTPIDERSQLYVVPTDGSQPAVQLSQFINVDVMQPALTSDGTRVVYWETLFGATKVFSVPVTGGTPVQLSLDDGFPPVVGGFAISPDGTRVVYSHAPADVFSAPIDGSEAAEWVSVRFGWLRFWSLPSPPWPAPPILRISPDSRRVVHLQDATIVGRFELFSVPIEESVGGLQEIAWSSARLNGPLVPGGDVVQFEIAPDGSRVVYRADQELDERFEVFSAPIEPRFAHAQLGSRIGRVKLNAALGAGQRVDEFWIAPAGGRVLFDVRIDATHNELFSSTLDGHGLAALTPGSLDASEPRFTPDGERAVFYLRGASNGVFSVATDGSEAPIQLFTASPDDPTEFPFVLSPDGEWVVCRANLDHPQRFEAYARPIDGSAPAVRLSGPMLADELDVARPSFDAEISLLVTSNSEHLIYVADQDADEVFELYASPMP